MVKLQHVMNPCLLWQSVAAYVHLPLLLEGLERALKRGKAIFMDFPWDWDESRPFY